MVSWLCWIIIAGYDQLCLVAVVFNNPFVVGTQSNISSKFIPEPREQVCAHHPIVSGQVIIGDVAYSISYTAYYIVDTIYLCTSMYHNIYIYI